MSTMTPAEGIIRITREDPTTREQIHSWLPDYTHVQKPGLLNPFAPTTWTWTTPQGIWTINLGGLGPVLTLAGPDGSWKFGPATEANLRRLHGVLLALNAITKTP